MNDIIKLNLSQTRDALKAKKISAMELTKAYSDAVQTHNPELNAFITLTPEQALANATASDKKIAEGKAGTLEGIPLAIKDLFCTNEVRTTAASKILEHFVPQYESSVTAKLWEAGAVMIGKTNLDEFAMGSSNMTSYFGNVVNPWGKNLVPGGSSGGSAAAVAAGLCLGATGYGYGRVYSPACGVLWYCRY